MAMRPKPLALIILDGWGYNENPEHNAIMAANTPNWDSAWSQYPHSLISGSGEDVGLPENQMGNSEVGHLNLGAGRVVYQKYTQITKAIEDQSFFDNATLVSAVDKATSAGKAVHIMGLLSPGGVHSHECQIHAMIQLAAKRGATQIYVHAFLDGRDTPPQSAADSLQALETTYQQLGVGQTATLVGRYYAMDRDKRWERVQQAYDLLTRGHAEYDAETALSGLQQAYNREETDEFVKPTLVGSAPAITDGDSVIFMNFRADRARELTRAFVEPQNTYFEQATQPKLSAFVMLTEYAADIQTDCAFPPETMKNVLGEVMANLGLKQLRIAETEKYAHVTFFFNGGAEAPFDGEDRILIKSPQVATYDLQPEMSAPELTEKLVEAIRSSHYDLIVCNFANPDMVGHTGNFGATVKAIEAIDLAIGQIISALKDVGGECLITADHGNAERMHDVETEQPHTAHTSEPVPFLYVGRKADIMSDGSLQDVAPTLLHLMGVDVPKEMTGQVLIELKE